ncbi:het-c2 protein [Dacryopinax primogenitus]|uniref:Het-c2 protein n=1 Tax=Dacryopinax primogenitus (strain DJM 731) TaxID=1858805 RepID=M5FVT6_DACPD|nr:het-c2 protein [Dacryopinax primogenitus]EJT97476.1 het-c2 protein [Dacryopinax primogenitus]
MPTYFDTIAMNFANVEVGPDGIETVQFLQAAEALSNMFTLFNSTAFSVVQSDINGNIKKLRERYDATGEKSRTIEMLVVNEQGEKNRTATQGLLWLNRGLRFTYVGLKHSYDHADSALSESFNISYGETLRAHHSFITRGVFSVAVRAVPHRASLLKSLGEPEDRVLQQLDEWLNALGQLTQRIDKFFETSDYAKGF